VFTSSAELVSAMGDYASGEEVAEILRLSSLGLPPVSSHLALSAMLGVNPGLVWSFTSKNNRYYRHFSIPKGNGRRHIDAPRVALKIVQKWISVQLQNCFQPPNHVFGFVHGRSHIQAARQHRASRWVYSVDISNFFPSTPINAVYDGLKGIGYGENSSRLIALLCCFRGYLAQGSPASPVISNIVFSSLDERLTELARQYDVRLTRYADDIVFSGKDDFPESLQVDVEKLFAETPWSLAEEKTELSELPARLKVHGLLVHGDTVRLTKGYRNKLRAYKHLLASKKIRESDLARICGHVRYGKYVDEVCEEGRE
jgi:RNA-directed DNA polymerase